MSDPNDRGWRILQVGPQEDVYRFFHEMLSRLDGQPVTLEWASSAQETRLKLAGHSYDAVLVSDALGIELIRERCCLDPAPFILISENPSREVDLEALRAGASMCLARAEVNPPLLERVIRFAIERRRVEGVLQARAAQTEQALRENEDRLRVALASAPISVYTTDCDLRINWMVAPYAGFLMEAYLGKRLDEILPGDLGAQLVAIQKQVLETGQAHQGEAPGQALDGPTWYAYYIDPIRDADGKMVGLACAGYDVTANKAGEEALRRSRNQLQTILASVPAGVVMADAAGEIFLTSAATGEILGAPVTVPGGGEGSYRLMDMEGNILSREETPFARALAGESIFNKELIVIRPDGRQEVILVSAKPLWDGEGKIWGAVSIFQAITALKQTEERLTHYAAQLERSNQALEEFSFIASHDLQEPLRKIQAFGHMLEDEYAKTLDVTGRDYIHRMVSAAQRMSNMIQDLLAYAGVTSGARPFSPVDLNQVAAGVLSDLEGRLIQTQGSVELDDLPTIHADAMQMRQLFQNLIGNALKYHQEGLPPRVKVSARRDGKKQVLLSFTDNGIGIEPSNARRIFDPFFRVHARTRYEGTGMGLAICKRIVERHNGTIAVQSQTGGGTTFLISLPVDMKKTGEKF